jgi:hypothetical protein
MEATVTVRMTQEFYDRLLRAAQIDRRRIGEFARILLEDAFKEWIRAHPEAGEGE